MEYLLLSLLYSTIEHDTINAKNLLPNTQNDADLNFPIDSSSSSSNDGDGDGDDDDDDDDDT